MSEAGFAFFSAVFPCGQELLYAACLALFLRPFMAEAGAYRRWRPWAAGFAYLSLSWLCQRAPQGVFSLLLTALLTALSGVLGPSRGMMFFLVLLYWNAKSSSGLIVQSLDFVGDRFWLAPADVPERIFLRSAILLAMLLASHALLLSAMLRALQRRLRKRRLRLDGARLCCLSLMPLAGTLFGHIIARLLFEMEDGVLLQLYDRHPGFLAVVPLLALLLYAGAWLEILVQQRMDALREEQAAHYAQCQQIQAIQARISEMERFYAQIRQLKHEMRGHLANIKGLVQGGEYAALEDYIQKLDGRMGAAGLALHTGNPVTDVIVNDKRRQCEELGVRFQAEFHYPEPGGYDAFDVGIILQNLLQNALDACEQAAEGERFVTLAGRRRGRFFLIEVRNSFAGRVAFGPDGLPVTSKREEASMHGIGLSNVRREAEKYMGELELKTDGQEFSATVLLQERSKS